MLINVLQVLDHSLPEQSGYSYRSHAILKELLRLGVGIEALTSPKQGMTDESSSEFDGVRYQRTKIGDGENTSGVVGQMRTVASTRRKISELLDSQQFDVLHAHSPCLNGLAAIGHGFPVIYEMRSSWEDAAVSVGTTGENSLRYRISKALETFVVRRADAVVVICEGLKNELLARGIADKKITVVPNALPPDMFELPEAGSVTKTKRLYVPQDTRLIGFFGSFFDWEGVDDLVRVMPLVIDAVPNAHLLLAGGGRQERTLKKLVSDHGLGGRVTFAGRVDHAHIKSMYGAIDVMAFPRVSDRLTNMVTPIKPLEAMAQGAIVVASDVGGHREMIRHDDTGYLYPAGNQQALAAVIIDVLQNVSSLGEMRKRARAYVETERRWSVVAEKYLHVYESIGCSVD